MQYIAPFPINTQILWKGLSGLENNNGFRLESEDRIPEMTA